MKNIFTALLATVAIGIALAGGIGLAVIGIPSTVAANAQVQEVDSSVPTDQLFTFDACTNLNSFLSAMKSNDGYLASYGDIPNDVIVSVVIFHDNSFGLFIYYPNSDMVCVISTGWFTKPGSGV